QPVAEQPVVCHQRDRHDDAQDSRQADDAHPAARRFAVDVIHNKEVFQRIARQIYEKKRIYAHWQAKMCVKKESASVVDALSF
ncbi:MAG TPA: hypothetical protein DC009_06215, partial [Porphyromonadaceae bacterium]|nr:hypothetical protein [Porphyromonadaceae bacterium]